MKKWKTGQIILFVALCICLNICGKILAVGLELPLWCDSFGTALCAYIAGPVCGAMVGFTGNLAYSVINHLSAAYSVTSIALGVIIGVAARRKWFERFYGFMMAASLAMLTALIISVPIDIILGKGSTGNKWGDGIVDFLLDKNWPPVICVFVGQLAIEFLDKIITIAAVYVSILIRRMKRIPESPKNSGVKSSAAVFLCLTLALSMSSPVRAEGDQPQEGTDYNDYVQSVYSSNNGLPCGEANDIAQTNDGVCGPLPL